MLVDVCGRVNKKCVPAAVGNRGAGPAHYILAMVQVEIFVGIVRVLRTCADKLTQRYERLRDCDIQA